MLATALRRNAGDRAFHDLQKRLLHPFAADVAGDRGVVGLSSDLVDLVDVDDPALRALDVVFGRLQKLEYDVFHIFPDIARFGQRGRVGHGERHIQNAGQGLRQQGLAAAGRADQQDVRLRQLDIRLRRMVQPFVVVVNRDRQHPLGVDLADHVIVQHLADFARGRHAIAGLQTGGLRLFADDVHAQFDAFVTDEYCRTRNQLAYLMLAFATERAVKRVLAVAGIACHPQTS